LKPQKVRELGIEELAAKVTELQEQIFRMRIKKATGQLGEAPKIRALRRDVARIKTVLGERSRPAKRVSSK